MKDKLNTQHIGGGNGHSLGLDLLRISLCVGVFIYHYTPDRCSSGPFMVIGFFMMSGFLLGLSFEKTESLDVCRFYRNKAKRLLPMFLFSLLLGGLFHSLRQAYITEAWSAYQWGSFSFIAFVEWWNIPLWYMGVEFGLLLAAPVMFCFFKIRWGIPILLAVSLLVAGFLFSRIPYCEPFGNGLYFSPYARCWQFVCGLLMAKVYLHKTPSRLCCMKKISLCVLIPVYVAIWTGLCILKQNSDLHYWNYTFGFDLLSSAFFALFIPLMYGINLRKSSRFAQCCQYLATLSYPVYLIHVTAKAYVGAGLKRFIEDDVPQSYIVVICAVLCIIMAAFMLKIQYRWIERK